MFLAIGCGSAASESAWAQAQGGVIAGDLANRAEAASAVLGLRAGRTVRVHVLDSETIGAYGWPEGDLFVTRGLVDRLSDRELAAAIAHEMGHLLNDGHLHTVVSLRGCCVSPDAEARADAIGVRLLASRGIGCDAMISMLNKVRASPGLSPSCQEGIGHRVELLSQLAATNH